MRYINMFIAMNFYHYSLPAGNVEAQKANVSFNVLYKFYIFVLRKNFENVMFRMIIIIMVIGNF